MTMAVELRMTAITGVFELRSGLNPSGQLVVSIYKVVIKAIIEFSCVHYVENNITSYDVSIGSWLNLLQLAWIVCMCHMSLYKYIVVDQFTKINN